MLTTDAHSVTVTGVNQRGVKRTFLSPSVENLKSTRFQPASLPSWNNEIPGTKFGAVLQSPTPQCDELCGEAHSRGSTSVHTWSRIDFDRIVKLAGPLA